MMLKLLKKNGEQASSTAHGRVIGSKSLVQKAVVNRPQTCISSGSAVDYDYSHRTLMEVGGVKSNNSQNLERGDHCLIMKEAFPLQKSESDIVSSVAKDGDSYVRPKTVESDKKLGYNIFPRQNDYSKIDANRIREALKRKRYNAAVSLKLVDSINAEMDSEAWIERELENGIELEYSSLEMKQRK